jgi:hypothetical protein
MAVSHPTPANHKTVLYKYKPANLRERYTRLILCLVGCLMVLSPLGARADTDKEAAAQTWVGAPIVGGSPCETLAQRVCGEHQECSGQEACSMVQQLLKSEQAERGASDNPNKMTNSSGRCQEAGRDRKLYTSCNLQRRSDKQ